MTAVTQSRVETKVFMTARLEQALQLAFAESERLRRERDVIADENRQLTAMVESLAEENEALRESAEIWIRMYENQLARANAVATGQAEAGVTAKAVA
jgi:FtsZ-binding cell division protein ZapB